MRKGVNDVDATRVPSPLLHPRKESKSNNRMMFYLGNLLAKRLRFYGGKPFNSGNN